MTSFSPQELKELLQHLQAIAPALVLVGGQAVNLWALHYGQPTAEWTELQPYTSTDLDFYGGRVEVVSCAQQLGGKAYVNRDFDASPNAGIVTVEYQGRPLILDILATVFGLREGEIQSTAVPFVGRGELAGLELQVLNPLLCLESKLKCYQRLPQSGRQDAKHCRMSRLVVGEYLREHCQNEDPRRGLKLIERLVEIGATESSLHGWYHLGLVVEAAIPIEAIERFTNPIWQRFCERRWPQIQSSLEQRRVKYRQITDWLEQRQPPREPER